MSVNRNGLVCSTDTTITPVNERTFYVKNTDPVVVENLVANTVITDELNLNGQAITADETAIFLNGVPYGGGGGGGVDTVTGTAPITVTGTVTDPVIGINLSGIVQTAGAQTITGGKKFTVFPQSVTGALPTDPDEFTNKLYVDNTIETWSQFPATQDVNMNLFKIANCAEIANNTTGYGLTITSDQDINIEAATGNIDITAQSVILHQTLDVNGYNLTGVGDIIGTTSNMLITTTTDITLKADEGVVEIDAKNLVITSNAPPGQLVSDSTLQISTDNDMTITATDSLSITAGVMTINNELSMATHKITNVVNPTAPQDVATKAYVDGALPGADPLSVVLGIGNSAGANQINMNSNKIVNVLDPTDAQDAATKAYVDSRPAPPADTLANVLLAGNSAGATNIDMNGQDITGVNDIVMTGLVPTISAPLSATLTVAGLGVTTVAAGTHLNITAPDYVSIGSAGYTTIENLQITNSVIEKVAGQADLQYKNVSSIEATGQLNVTAAPFCYNSTDLNDKDFNVAGSAQIVANFSKTIGLYTAAGDLTLQVADGDLQLQSGTGNIAISTDGGDVVENLLSGSNHYIADTTSLPSNAATGILEIQSNTKGIYIPRMTSAQRESISSPQNGLLVFDTTASALYMYGARGWAKVALTNSANELLQSLSGLDGGVRTYSLTGLTEVDTLAVKTNAIQPLDPLIGSDVGVEAQLVWEGDILLKNNGNSAGTDVVIDSIPAAPTSLGNVVSYNPTTKKLYYQAAGGGGGGAVNSVVAGTNISVDNTDPANPIVNLDVQTGIEMNDNGISNLTFIHTTVVEDLLIDAMGGQSIKLQAGGSDVLTINNAVGAQFNYPVDFNNFALLNCGAVTGPNVGTGMGFTAGNVQISAIGGDVTLTPGQSGPTDKFIRAQGDIRIEANQASGLPGSLNFVGTGTPLLLNSAAGVSGNLLCSGGSTGTPSWSTGLRYDPVKKVLFAG